MKKAALALIASLALVLGAGALGNTATAAPYPGTVTTKTTITRSSSVTEGKTFNLTVRVTSGNVTVNGGKVSVIFGGKKWASSLKNGRATMRVKAPSVKKTTNKTMNAYYTPFSSSVFKSSNDSRRIKVKNK